MTKLQEKTLIDAGFSDSAIDTILADNRREARRLSQEKRL